ncbi:hypothetical protein ACFSUM_06365, partial [Virgibacillus siamensis]
HLRTISQHRFTCVHRVSFISCGKIDQLKPPLCAATLTHPAWQGAVRTSLTERLRFFIDILVILFSFQRAIHLLSFFATKYNLP